MVVDKHWFDIREVSVGQLLRVFQVFDRVRPLETVFGTARTRAAVLHGRRQRVPFANGHFDCRLAYIVFDTINCSVQAFPLIICT